MTAKTADYQRQARTAAPGATGVPPHRKAGTPVAIPFVRRMPWSAPSPQKGLPTRGSFRVTSRYPSKESRHEPRAAPRVHQRLPCGCVVGRYLELSGNREVVYVEEKGGECAEPRPSPQPRDAPAPVARAASGSRLPRSPGPRRIAAVTEPTRALFDALRRHGVTLRFFLGDCLECASPPSADVGGCRRHLAALQSRHQVPPVRGQAAARATTCDGPADGCARSRGPSRPDGSLFLNVGAKPKDPWVAMDIAQAVRPHLQLQNTIHWVKSIVDRARRRGRGGGAVARSRGRPLQADQQPALRERLPRVHLPLHAAGDDAARPDGDRRSVPGPVERRRGGSRPARRPAVPGQRVVPALRDDQQPREGPAAPGHVPGAAAGVLPAAARRRIAGASCVDPFLGLGSTARGLRARSGVDFVGVELDRQYLDEAVARRLERHLRIAGATCPD